MATNSDKKLTRYTSAVTVVTADVMNSFFGGEYGYNTTADPNDPLVAGHVHDGEHADGHASKIILTDGKHVTGVITHDQLGGSGGTTPAVQYENIQCYSESAYAKHAPGVAIPEYTTSGGDRCYYLDLSMTIGGSDKNVQYNKDTEFGGDDGFVYDYTAKRVGVGTTAPVSLLHVEGDSNDATITIRETAGSSKGPDLSLQKSRGVASVADNDNLANIIVSGYDGSVFQYGGGIQFRSDGAPALNDMPTEMRLVTRPAGVASVDWNDHTRMIIRSDGNIGINEVDPETMLHIVGDGYTSPLRLDNVLSGEGVVLVIDGYSGDVHFDASIGSPQMLFETVALSATGGSVFDDLTIVADQIDDTLSLKADNNIELTGDDTADSIVIKAIPSGNDGHIQYNDADEFGGDGGLLYNKTPGGGGVAGAIDGAHVGPKITLYNTTAGDGDYDRYSSVSFSGKESVGNTFLSANIGGFHHAFGSGTATAGRGGFYIQTYNATDAKVSAALIIDSGDKNPDDKRGYVGIGAVDPSSSAADADAVTRFEPKRKLHIKETPPTNPAALAVHSPLRINDLEIGRGELVLWNGVATTGLAATLPDAGDIYYLPKGNSGDYLGIDENGNLQWYPTQGKVESGTDFDTEVAGPYTPTADLGAGVWRGDSFTVINTAKGMTFKSQGRGIATRKAAGTPVNPAKGVRYGVVIEDNTTGDPVAFFVGGEVHGAIGQNKTDEWEFDFTMNFSSATGGDPTKRDISVGGGFTLYDGDTLTSSRHPMRIFRKSGYPSAPSDPGDGKQFKNVSVVANGIRARFVVLRPDAVTTNVQNVHTDGLIVTLESFATQLNPGEEA